MVRSSPETPPLRAARPEPLRRRWSASVGVRPARPARRTAREWRSLVAERRSNVYVRRHRALHALPRCDPCPGQHHSARAARHYHTRPRAANPLPGGGVCAGARASVGQCATRAQSSKTACTLKKSAGIIRNAEMSVVRSTGSKPRGTAPVAAAAAAIICLALR